MKTRKAKHCSVPGCKEKYMARGYCHKHYSEQFYYPISKSKELAFCKISHRWQNALAELVRMLPARGK